MKKVKSRSNLVKSWASLSKLMTFAKEHFFVFRYIDRGVTRYLSIKKFAETRWIGLIIQAEKLLKAEKDVKNRASTVPALQKIVDGID